MCSAERPRCSVCVERQTPCEYTTLPTETHLRAQKRKLTDLEIKCQAYEDLLSILRSRPDSETNQVLQRLRMGEDVQAIVNAVQDGDLLLQLSLKPDLRFRYEFPYIREMPPHLDSPKNPYLCSILYEKTSVVSLQPSVYVDTLRDVQDESQKIYLVPYHTAELVDSRIASASVSSWTKVSSDNPMLRVLLQIYFVFEFPFHPYFHKDMFLEDLLAGSRQFCSSSLVNAILGAAWHGYSKMRNRAVFWLPDNLGYRFLAEARRLFELEQTNPTVTTVQAGAIIHLTSNNNGIDSLSWVYVDRSIKMAQSISLLSPSPDESREWQLVASATAWSLFNWQALAAFHTFQPPILKDPPARPLPDVDDYGEIWVQYPLGREPIAMFNGLVFRAVSEFRVIMNEVAKLSFGRPKSSNRMSLDAAIGYRSRLSVCIHYHVLLIGLFEPFVQMGAIHTEANPSTIVSHSKAYFETLMRIYYLRHGFESLDVTLVQFLHLLGFSALKDLSLVEKGTVACEALRSTLMLCAKGLWEQGQNYYLSEAIFRMFKQSMGIEEVLLLRDIIDIEDPDGWLDRMIQEIRSRWPIGNFSMTDDGGERTLERFIRWQQQFLQDKAQDGTAMEQDGSSVTPPRYPERYGMSSASQE
ncbi:hypothetical protein Hte_004257 [Hypoxylon texense]